MQQKLLKNTHRKQTIKQKVYNELNCTIFFFCIKKYYNQTHSLLAANHQIRKNIVFFCYVSIIRQVNRVTKFKQKNN